MPSLEQKVLSGHVKNNVIVLDNQVQLPDGIKVKVIIEEAPAPSGLCGIWQDDRPVEKIVEEIVGARSSGRNMPSL